MWTSPDGNSNNNTSRLTCSPSDSDSDSDSKSKTKSSSTCSSSSLFSPSSPTPITPSPPSFPDSSNTTRKPMEEVWKDITLASLHDHHSTSTSTTLQEFLATPFHKDPSSDPSSCACEISFLGALPPPPAGIMSLNNSGSGFECRFLESNTCAGSLQPTPQLQTATMAPLVVALDTLRSSSVCPTDSKKRPQENGDNSTDRRHKRMIKNRESAARSRARKQAYTNELELEVAHLQEENARLRRQQAKLCLAGPAQLPKKHTLQRTSTAPF
nr:bZIP transcription factor 27-like [Ziziphus jujuba var. spinosa]XP_048332232.1 bZIP transcription factor 27-like [Ziziphus jujuba var. spinosa]